MKKIFLIFAVLLLLITTCGCVPTAPVVIADSSTSESNSNITLDKCLEYGDYQWVEIEDCFVEDTLKSLPCKYVIYNSSDLTAEILESRKGIIIVERCFGFVTNKETGDGKILNAADKNYDYISYRSVTEKYCDGTVFLSYMIYNPENNYVDDITERYDFVLSREWED